MGTENNPIETNSENTTIEGVNILKIDGPIGRIEFFKTYVLLILFTIIFYAILGCFFNYFDEKHPQLTYLPWFVLIVICATIFSIYISFINYVKRIFDFVGDKQHAIFYTFAIFIGSIAASIIPVINIISTFASIAIFMVLLFKKGNL